MHVNKLAKLLTNASQRHLVDNVNESMHVNLQQSHY